jgi:hypothetical protein
LQRIDVDHSPGDYFSAISEAKLKHWNHTSRSGKPALPPGAPVHVQGLGNQHVLDGVALAGDLQLGVAVGALEIVVQVDR